MCEKKDSEFNFISFHSRFFILHATSTHRLFFGTNNETANASNCQPCKKVNDGGFDLQSSGGKGNA